MRLLVSLLFPIQTTGIYSWSSISITRVSPRMSIKGATRPRRDCTHIAEHCRQPTHRGSPTLHPHVSRFTASHRSVRSQPAVLAQNHRNKHPQKHCHYHHHHHQLQQQQQQQCTLLRFYAAGRGAQGEQGRGVRWCGHACETWGVEGSGGGAGHAVSSARRKQKRGKRREMRRETEKKSARRKTALKGGG